MSKNKNKSVGYTVTPVEYVLEPLERFDYNEFGDRRLSKERSRLEVEKVVTYVTTRSIQSTRRLRGGGQVPCGVQTVSLYGVQGVIVQPPMPPRAIWETAA